MSCLDAENGLPLVATSLAIDQALGPHGDTVCMAKFKNGVNSIYSQYHMLRLLHMLHRCTKVYS